MCNFDGAENETKNKHTWGLGSVEKALKKYQLVYFASSKLVFTCRTRDNFIQIKVRINLNEYKKDSIE
jgi:hypothetical protein